MMLLLGFSVLLVLVSLVLVELDSRRRRAELVERLGRMVKTPQRTVGWATDVPDFCELCGRSMVRPAGRAMEISPSGERQIFTCAACLDDPLMSVCTAV